VPLKQHSLKKLSNFNNNIKRYEVTGELSSNLINSENLINGTVSFTSQYCVSSEIKG